MGRKSKAESRRPEILEHTYTTLLEESLESASLAKIARRAGIAPSLITHYFNSKEELIFALTDFLTEKYDAFLMQDFFQIADPEERLRAIITTRLREFTNTAVEERVWYDLFALALRNPRIKEKLQEMYRRDREALVKQLAGCASRPVAPPELESLARMITVTMEGLGYYAVLMDNNIDLMEETKRLEVLILNEARALLLG